MNNTILLVDDEENILKSLKRLLRKDGYEILIANSGQEALDLLEKNRVQVVLSDQRMPNMTGSELLEKVRQLYPETVRMILSGYADFESVVDAINNGKIFRFLNKPWNDEDIRENVKSAFEKQRNKETLVSFDENTKLYNSFYFDMSLSAKLAEYETTKQPFGLVMVDIDHFDRLRQVFGSQSLEQVIILAAKELKAWSETKNADPCRLTEDQFAVICRNLSSKEEFTQQVKEVFSIYSKAYNIDDQSLAITASVGGVFVNEKFENPKVLIRKVISLVNTIKEEGRNTFKVSP